MSNSNSIELIKEDFHLQVSLRCNSSLLGCETMSNQNTQQALPLPEKEVIQPHLPVRLPCYDFTPVTSPAFDIPLLVVRLFRGQLSGFEQDSRLHKSTCMNLHSMNLQVNSLTDVTLLTNTIHKFMRSINSRDSWTHTIHTTRVTHEVYIVYI